MPSIQFRKNLSDQISPTIDFSVLLPVVVVQNIDPIFTKALYPQSMDQFQCLSRLGLLQLELGSVHFEQQYPDLFYLQQDPPMPNFFKMISNGQKLVNDDWKRFNPTNAVNQSQFGL